MRSKPTKVQIIRQELATISDSSTIEWDVSPCLEWKYAKDPGGYGVVKANSIDNPKSRLISVHRVAYEIQYGAIPAGLHVCHRCDNRSCFRPSHLFVGTAAENQADSVRKGRSNRGERHGNTKVTASDVLQIRTMRATGISIKALASQFGLSRTGVRHVVSRNTWKHIP